MKITLSLLVTALLATVSSVHGGPWIAYQHPAAAYNLVQPITVPTNHWSAIVRSNLVGGSFAYSVHEGRAVHQPHPAAVVGPQLVSSNVQPSVVAIHLANPAAGYPIISGAVAPQWVVQPSLLPGAGGFTFIPAGAQLPGRPPVGAAAPGGPAVAAPPPSVDADDVVTVSDEADGASGNNAEQAEQPSTAEESGEGANDVVDEPMADDVAGNDDGADDTVSVESA